MYYRPQNQSRSIWLSRAHPNKKKVVKKSSLLPSPKQKLPIKKVCGQSDIKNNDINNDNNGFVHNDNDVTIIDDKIDSICICI